MKNLFFEALTKAKQERRKSSARSAQPLLKLTTMLLLLLMVTTNAWGYDIPITHPTLVGVTQKAGNATTASSENQNTTTLTLYYNVTSGYDPTSYIITVKTGYGTFTTNTSTYTYTYAHSWTRDSETQYHLDIYGSSVKWTTGGEGNAYMQVNIELTSSTPTYTVSFDAGANNVLVAGSSGISGGGTRNGSITTSSMSTLPTATPCDAAAAEGWTFDGWRAGSAISGEADSYTNKVTTPYNPSSNITLYAVYKKSGSTIPSTGFTKQTGTMPTSGKVILSQMNDAVSAITNTTNRTYISEVGSGVSMSGSTATTTNGNCVWIVASPASGQYTFQNLVTGKYIGSNSSGEGVLLNEVTDYAKWVVNSTSSNGFYLTNVGKSGYFLKYSSGSGWKAASTTKNGTTDHIYVWLYSSALSTTGTKYRSTLTCSETYRVYYEAGCDESEISGTIPVNTNEYASGATAPVAENTITRTGYTFVNWLCDYNSSYYDGDGTDEIDMPSHDVTMTAQWTPKSYTITLHDNNGGDNNGSANVQFNGTSLTSITAPTRTGYTIEGYYTEAECTNKIATDEGNLQASISVSAVEWTNSSSQWKKDGNATFYANWQVKQCIITLDNQSATTPGTSSVTATYGSNTNLTKIGTNPTKTDYKFGGYYTGMGGTGAQLIDKDGYWIANVDGYTDASRNWQLDATTLTLYAYWTEKSFGNPMAWCPEPTITLTGGENVKITSRNGVMLRAINQLTLSAENMAYPANVTLTSNNAGVYFSTTATSNIAMATADQPKTSLTFATNSSGAIAEQTIWVHYMPAADATDNDGVIRDVTVTAEYSVDNTVSEATTMQVRNLPDNIVIAAKVGGGWYALPANMGHEQNPALVSIDVNETSWTAAAPSSCAYKLWPVKTVNPNLGTDRYNSVGSYYRFAAVNSFTEGNTTYNNAGLWAITSTSSNFYIRNWATIAAISTDVTTNYEWKTTIAEAGTTWKYTLQQDREGNNTNFLNIKSNDVVWGTYNSGYQLTNEIYLLPMTEITPFEMNVVEWYPTKVLVSSTSNLTTLSPTVSINGSVVTGPTFTKKGTNLYEISGLSTLANNPTKTLTVSYTSGDTYSASVKIPVIIWESQNLVNPSGDPVGGYRPLNEPFASLTKEVYSYADLVVRDGATLTINGTSPQNTFYDVTIYPNSKISVPATNANDASNVFNIHSLTFFGGIDEIYNGSTYTVDKYGVPELSLKGNFGSKTVTKIDYLMRVDADQMYSLTVPYDVNLSEITYWDGTSMGELGDKLWVSAYDGQARANKDMSHTWIWEANFASKGLEPKLKAGVGYTISSDYQYDGDSYSIIRMPMNSNVGSNATEEAKTVRVEAYANQQGVEISANHKGWNLVGNPYMVTISGGDADTKLVVGYLTEHKVDGKWDGSYDWENDTYRYVTIPNDNGTDYSQAKFSVAELKPFKNFFIQVETTGDLSFALASRQNAPARYLEVKEREVEFEILLDNGSRSDNMGLLIADKYSPAYEINADLEKMIGTMAVYTIYGGYNLAYNALSQTDAEQLIPVGYVAPTAGEYTFALDDNSDYEEIEHIYLTDYAQNKTVDLLTDSYTFTTTAGKDEGRFAINVILKDEPDPISTSLEAVDSNSDGPVKFIYQDKMYILHRGVIYDATGKKVRQINK